MQALAVPLVRASLRTPRLSTAAPLPPIASLQPGARFAPLPPVVAGSSSSIAAFFSPQPPTYGPEEGPRPKAVETRPIRTLWNLPSTSIRGWKLPPRVQPAWQAALEGGAWVMDSVQEFVSNVRTLRELRQKPVERLTYPQRMAMHRTQEDIWRLGPFLLYNMIPFSGMFLPVVVRLYPALLPSTFTTAEGALDDIAARHAAQLACADAFYTVTLDRVVDMESKWVKAGRPKLAERPPLDLEEAVEEEMVKSFWWRAKLSGRNPTLLWEKFRNDPQALSRELQGAMRSQVKRAKDMKALAKAAAKVSRSFVQQMETVRDPGFWQVLWGKHGLGAAKSDAEQVAELSWNPRSLRKELFKTVRPDVVSLSQLLEWNKEYESAFRFEALTDMELSLMTGFLGVAPVSPFASRYTLVRRLQDRMEYLIEADAWMMKHGMGGLSDAELRDACVSRGIFVMSPCRGVWYSRKRQEAALEQWLHVTVKQQAPVHWLLSWRLLHVASNISLAS